MAEVRKEGRAAVKPTMKKIFSRFRIKYQKLIRRCPRQLRGLGGPLLGGIIGFIGGIPGVIIGLLMGYLLSKLFVQSIQNRRILDYLENPGKQEFYEGESGLASWCALSVLVVLKSSASELPEEKLIRKVVLETCYTFTSPLSDPLLIEHFSRLTMSNSKKCNPDLLAESLAARRSSQGDSKNLSRLLFGLADGEKAKEFAADICRILDPEWDLHVQNTAEPVQKDPWKILGLSPGTPYREVKAHYRRLAKQFHPDELEVLDEKHRQAAARAFIAIKEAYTEISGE